MDSNQLLSSIQNLLDSGNLAEIPVVIQDTFDKLSTQFSELTSIVSQYEVNNLANFLGSLSQQATDLFSSLFDGGLVNSIVSFTTGLFFN